MLGNVLGWLVATFARTYCEQFPYLMIDAPEQDSGKTTVAEGLCCTIVRGGVSGTRWTAQARLKALRSLLEAGKPGPVPFLLDNLERPDGATERYARPCLPRWLQAGPFNSGASMLRTGRLAYPLVVMTMNQANLSVDLSSRVVHVRVQNGALCAVTPYPPGVRPAALTRSKREAVTCLRRTALSRTTGRGFFNFHRVAAGGG
jgi:hypothetical protein